MALEWSVLKNQAAVAAAATEAVSSGSSTCISSNTVGQWSLCRGAQNGQRFCFVSATPHKAILLARTQDLQDVGKEVDDVQV